MNGLPPGVLSKPAGVQSVTGNSEKTDAPGSGRKGMGRSAIGSPEKGETLSGGVVFTDPKSEGLGYNAALYQGQEEYTPPIHWMLCMLLYLVPIINIVSLVVIMFKTEAEDKKNWAKASLIVLLISYIVGIVSLLVLKNVSLMQMFDAYTELRGIG